ncbi:hypothetical protein PIB30_055586 [Stylosanthes scabra]|uniref:F-box domain-containing protein n=1 Tax=Stylosanthes scabra TaxID=79078 RepID=A0ABU6TIY0_9FABA|nr:hypothetical protein [Stylosanthes scabra]
MEELIPSLPYDVALNCLARLPRFYHSTLSQVSNPIRSLLSSPFFYEAHSALHGEQTMLYFSVNYPESNDLHWFMINLDDPDPLLRLPLIPSLTFRPSTMCAQINHDIYVLGGYTGDALSPEVWILDCRFNRWRQGPSMHIPRDKGKVTVLDRKIYLFDGEVLGQQQSGSGILGEVLDTVVGSWEVIMILEGADGSPLITSDLIFNKMKEASRKIVSPPAGLGNWPTWMNRVLYSYVDGPSPTILAHELTQDGTWVQKIVKGSYCLVPPGMNPVMAKTRSAAARELFLLWLCHRSMKPPEVNEDFANICCLKIEIKRSQDGQLYAIACDGGLSYQFYSSSFITDGCSIQQCFALQI